MGKEIRGFAGRASHRAKRELTPRQMRIIQEHKDRSKNGCCSRIVRKPAKGGVVEQCGLPAPYITKDGYRLCGACAYSEEAL